MGWGGNIDKGCMATGHSPATGHHHPEGTSSCRDFKKPTGLTGPTTYLPARITHIFTAQNDQTSTTRSDPLTIPTKESYKLSGPCVSESKCETSTTTWSRQGGGPRGAEQVEQTLSDLTDMVVTAQVGQRGSVKCINEYGFRTPGLLGEI